MSIASRYTSREWLRLEFEQLWPAVWWMAGWEGDLGAEGSAIACSLGPYLIEVWRAADGALEVRDAHGPRAGARAESFAGMVWVCLSADAVDLPTWLGPVHHELLRYDIGSLALESDVTMPLSCNWKASVDVHNETYHIHTLHPQVLGVLDDTAAEITLWPPHARIVVPFGRASRRRSPEIDAALAGMLREARLDPAEFEARPDEARAALIAARRALAPASPLRDTQLLDNHMFYVFPNLQLNCYANHVMVFRHRPDAEDPGRCLFDQQIYTRKGDRGRRLGVHRLLPRDSGALGPVTGADLDAVEQLQLGMMSRGFAKPVWSASESPIAQMHASLEAYLEVDR